MARPPPHTSGILRRRHSIRLRHSGITRMAFYDRTSQVRSTLWFPNVSQSFFQFRQLVCPQVCFFFCSISII